MRFVIERKLFAVVRYYETMHVIRDTKNGDVIYSGKDEKTAKEIRKILNVQATQRVRRKAQKKAKGKR